MGTACWWLFISAWERVCENFICHMFDGRWKAQISTQHISPTDWLRPQIYGPGPWRKCFLQNFGCDCDRFYAWNLERFHHQGVWRISPFNVFTALAAVFFWKIWSPLENCLGIGQVFWKVWECPVMSRVGKHASTRYIYIRLHTHIPTQSYTIQTYLQLLDIYFCVCFCDHVPPSCFKSRFSNMPFSTSS